MADELFEIHFFYSHKGNKREGSLMFAGNKSGKNYWKTLSPEERAELVARAQSVFEEPYHPKTTETPGGSSNVKNAFVVDEWHPEGYLTVGWWWDRRTTPEEYYKKQKWEMNSPSEEGRFRSKEVR